MSYTGKTSIELPHAATKDGMQLEDIACVGSLFDDQVGSATAAKLVLIADAPIALQQTWQRIAPMIRPDATVMTYTWPIVSLDAAPVDQWYTYDMAELGNGVQFEGTHIVSVFHPQYDGFLNIRARALFDIEDFRLEVDAPIRSFIEPHFLDGPLAAGQERAIDLELHPGSVPGTAIHGSIRSFDGERELGAYFAVTLASSRTVDCEVTVFQASNELNTTNLSTRKLIRAIRAHEGESTNIIKRLLRR